MRAERTCVFPGRFQPFHRDHAALLLHAGSQFERVIVVISNAHISHTERDPFTGGERFGMIDRFIRSSDIAGRVVIVPMPVDDQPTHWVATIKSACPSFDAVYTRNASVAHLFAFWGIPAAGLVLSGHDLSGTDVRRAIAADTGWQELLPLGAAEVVREVGGVERVRAMAAGTNMRVGARGRCSCELGQRVQRVGPSR
ncbi:MAG: nadR [Frankiales bacterium]|nr:nadR [Frankiales bacterium]